MQDEQWMDEFRDPDSGLLDLTGDSVIRKRSTKTKRAAESTLLRLLPRRRRGWDYSAQARAERVRLLPLNPMFHADVTVVRESLGLPAPQKFYSGRIRSTGVTKKTAKPDREPGRELAERWMAVHRAKWRNLPDYADESGLPKWVLSSAEKCCHPRSCKAVPWLCQRPVLPEPYSSVDAKVPIDWTALRLVDRYGLPWSCAQGIVLYLLLDRCSILKRLYTEDVDVSLLQRRIGSALRVTIDWIDEFSSEDDWIDIFRRRVKPYQESLALDRGRALGSRSHGAVNPPSWVWEMVRQGGLTGERGVDSLIEELSFSDDYKDCSIDRSVAFDWIKRLRALMRPLD